VRAQYVVAVIAAGLVAWWCYDIHKNRDSMQLVYLAGPTIGSVKPPPLQYTAPITNTQGSPWLGGGAAPSWSYNMNMV
jgi:hypothetical protein